MPNPLLEAQDLPDYAAIRASHVEEAVRLQLAENRRRLAELLAAPQFSFTPAPSIAAGYRWP